MGQIPLLTKDEEVEISKKIEMGEDIILDAICYVPYLIDFILEYREPLVNRERKVKELFKNFDDDEDEEDEEDEEEEEEEDEEEGDAGGVPHSRGGLPSREGESCGGVLTSGSDINRPKMV